MSKIVVLMYNLDNDKGKKIEQFSRSIGLRAKNVGSEYYNQPIEALLSDLQDKKDSTSCGDSSGEIIAQDDVSASSTDNAFEDEMLVLCGFNSRLLDIFLKEYKKRKLEPVALKAILTEHNKKWNSVQLHAELCRERAAFTKR